MSDPTVSTSVKSDVLDETSLVKFIEMKQAQDNATAIMAQNVLNREIIIERHAKEVLEKNVERKQKRIDMLKKLIEFDTEKEMEKQTIEEIENKRLAEVEKYKEYIEAEEILCTTRETEQQKLHTETINKYKFETAELEKKFKLESAELEKKYKSVIEERKKEEKKLSEDKKAQIIKIKAEEKQNILVAKAEADVIMEKMKKREEERKQMRISMINSLIELDVERETNRGNMLTEIRTTMSDIEIENRTVNEVGRIEELKKMISEK